MSDTETPFSAADLEPSPEEKRAARNSIADRIAATVAALAAGIWVGGIIALGVCAAPFVFRLTPAPLSGDAMGSAFARFDQIALGAAVVILGAEVVRTMAAGPRGRTIAARVRRAAAILVAVAAGYSGLVLTPRIMELHRAGAVRGSGPEGQELDAIHRRSELLSKVKAAGGIALVVLHVLTLRVRRPEDELFDYDDDDAVAPLPPGPRD
jgi:hypothetical protein